MQNVAVSLAGGQILQLLWSYLALESGEFIMSACSKVLKVEVLLYTKGLNPAVS